MDGTEIRQRYDALQSLRKTFDNTLQEIERYCVPHRGEFYRPMQSENEVEWKRRNIYDSTAPVSCNLLASQMHGNLIPPSAPWFNLRFRDEDMNEDSAAKEWLESTQDRERQGLLESDFHNEASEVFLDLVSYGTSVIMMEPKSETEWEGIDFTAIPMVDCYFEMKADGTPHRVYRRLRYTKLQLADRFKDLPSEYTEDMSASDVDEKYIVVFCVYYEDDNKDADTTGVLAPDMRPVAYKYIMHKDGHELETGGYYEFPAMVVRWQKVAGSRWGYSPALVALSDILQLNEVVALTSEARAIAIAPPQKTTSRGVIGDLDLRPFGLTLVEEMDDVGPMLLGSDFVQADAEIERLQASIRSTMFVDKLELKESPAMTATEVNVRYERMLRLMAPTLGRLQNDFLNPVIENMFKIMNRMGQFDELPESAAGKEMDIEYIGPLPRAQKGEIAQSMEMWLGGIAQMAEIFPQAMDIPDVDQYVRTQADMRGVPAKVMKTEDEVEQVRAERAEQEQQMQEAQNIQMGGEAMKAAGEGAQAAQAAGLEAVQ